MTKKNTSQQRLIAAARKALTVRHTIAPVPAYNAKVARLDVAGKRARRAENQPTPEQEAKAVYVEADVNERVGGTRIKLGRAFQRQARFESIEGLTLPQLLALRRYRRAFDVSELSPVKSALDVGPGGGGGSGAEAAITRMEAIAFADIGLRRIEAGLPQHLLWTLRAVALYDQDFKTAAVARYGSASSRRRERVRQEFMAAATALAGPPVPAPVTPVPSAPVPTPIAVAVPAAYLNDSGHMRPLTEIAAIIRAAQAAEADEAA